MSYDKEFRVVKAFDSRKGIIKPGEIVTFRTEQDAEHHLKFGYVEPATFEAPKKRVLKVSSDFKSSEAISMLSDMEINEARLFASEDTRKGVQKALSELVKAKSEKRKG